MTEKEKAISFKTISEDFSHYELEDGITLKTKITLNRIIDRGQKDPKGNPILTFDGLTQTLVEGNIEMHTPSTDTEVSERDIIKENIKFEAIEEKIQVYHIPNYKLVLLLTMIPLKIGLTSKYDKQGYPVYHVTSRNKIMLVKFPED